MRGEFWRNKWVILTAAILATGLIRLPWEGAMLTRMREQGFHPSYAGVSAVEQIGVQSFVGVLGGLRYMIATYMEVDAWTDWAEGNWDELTEKYQLVALLQPREADTWIQFGWHLAYNASAWTREPRLPLTQVQRQILHEDYVSRGIALLEQGTRWCPDNAWLWRDLGQAYLDKRKDYCKAAEAFRKGSQVPNAPDFLRRFYAYNIAKCPGHEEEAYRNCLQIYEEGKRVLIEQGVMIWKPTLITTIRDLEDKLDIPLERRIPERLEEGSTRIRTPLLKSGKSRATDKN